MHQNILRSIIGIVALATMGAANATVFTLPTSGPGPALGYGDIGFVPVTFVASGASFSDDFFFTLSNLSKLDSNVTSIDLAGFGFASFGAKLIDTATSAVVGTGLNFSLASLASGPYELEVF